MGKKEFIQQICNMVNPRLAYELQRRGEEVRQVSYKDVEGFLNDRAQKKSKNIKKLAKQVLDLALHTKPNQGEVKDVVIKDDLYYAAINEGQYNKLMERVEELYRERGKYYGSITMQDLPVGAFFTNDEGMLKVRNEKELRNKVALSHLFKNDVFAVVVARANNTQGRESLIGPQFDFGKGEYFKASMIEQLEVSYENKVTMNFVDVIRLKDIYENNN